MPFALRAWAVIRSGILTLAAILGVLCIAAFAAALVFGVRPVVVISGSMEPAVPVGSVVFTIATPAGEIEPGEIVTVDRPRNLGLVTHRLVSSQAEADGSYSYVLKGDANQTDDPESYSVTKAGRYIFHVVALGYISLVLQGPSGWMWGGAAALALAAIFIFDPHRLRGRESPTPHDVMTSHSEPDVEPDAADADADVVADDAADDDAPATRRPTDRWTT